MNLVRVGLSPRANGLTRLAAQKHWAGVHAALFAQVPYVESYVQNHLVLDDRGEPLLGDPGFDIFSEVEFQSCTMMKAAMSSAWYRDEVVPDERQLLDASQRCFLMTLRYGACLDDEDADHVKLVEFLACPGGRHQDSSASVLSGNDKVFASGLWDRARASVYVVTQAEGAAARKVDLLLAQPFVSIGCARKAHEYLRMVLADDCDLQPNLAVIVKENRVRPRVAGISGEDHGRS